MPPYRGERDVERDGYRFHDVDSSKDPQFFSGSLTRRTAAEMSVSKRSSSTACGCGAGAACSTWVWPGRRHFQIAERVGPSGTVTGVDVSTSMIEEARRRAEERGLPVDFEVGDSQALRLRRRHVRRRPRGTDADARTRCRPGDCREMARVLAPGGRISVFDFDWETQFCDSPYKETTRTIALTFCDGMKNGWIGRRMPRLFESHGITDVAVKTETVFVTYEFLNCSSAAMSRVCTTPASSRARRPINGGPRWPRLTATGLPLRLHGVYRVRSQGLSRTNVI